MDLIREILLFLKSSKKLWLAPIILILLILGSLIIFTQSGSILAPFLYTLF